MNDNEEEVDIDELEKEVEQLYREWSDLFDKSLGTYDSRYDEQLSILWSNWNAKNLILQKVKNRNFSHYMRTIDKLNDLVGGNVFSYDSSLEIILEKIKYHKNLFVRSQQYDKAATIRGIEKSL